jgi:Nucleoside-diphosphate-sugar pyrophosphorylase involved in lipopolysaccharide biosynthesis/translation initiation factor 2B, gamma/epsilon subunits (eIF-2Bgamma/eIF-2Bepsilon)
MLLLMVLVGVVLVAGEGTRLRPLTYTLPKPLIPVMGKPLIVRAIENLRDSGIGDFHVVVGHSASYSGKPSVMVQGWVLGLGMLSRVRGWA